MSYNESLNERSEALFNAYVAISIPCHYYCSAWVRVDKNSNSRLEESEDDIGALVFDDQEV